MQRFLRLFTLACFIAASLYGCREKPALSEKAEMALWEPIFHKAFLAIENSHQLEEGIRVYDSILKVGGVPSLHAKRVWFELHTYYYYFHNFKPEVVAHYLDSSISLFNTSERRAQYPRAITGFRLFRGDIAFRLNQFDVANEQFFLAKTEAEQYLNECERSGFFYSIAMVLYRQKNFPASLSGFKEAYANQATCPVQNRGIGLQQQEIQGNIGLCYVQLKKYDSALYHFHRELEVANHFKDSLGPHSMALIQGVAYGNMAKVYKAWQRPDSAEVLYRRSLAFNNRPGYEVRDAQLVAMQLSELYAQQKRFGEMRSLLDSARRAIDTLHDASVEVEWRRLTHIYYRETNRPLEELSAYKNYIQLRDSLAESQKQLEQADVTRQLRAREQELQINLLVKGNELNRIYLWVALAIAVMAAGIIILVFMNWRRSRKSLAAQTELNKQISLQKSALERANQEKDRILHVVAHDLRSPIGVTAYVADQVMLDEPNPAVEGQLQLIREASSQALALTNELLGLQGGSQSFVRCDLVALLKTVAAMLEYKAREKRQQIKTNLPPQPVWLQAQPERLQRVASNLLTNAIKFSPEGSTVELQVINNSHEVVLIVRDHGIGIPESMKKEVFDRFTTARRKGTAGEHSFGLGLSIVRDIIEAHHGTVELTSEEGKGTEFRIVLPGEM
jgi:signal transduction histidine kinase